MHKWRSHVSRFTGVKYGAILCPSCAEYLGYSMGSQIPEEILLGAPPSHQSITQNRSAEHAALAGWQQ